MSRARSGPRRAKTKMPPPDLASGDAKSARPLASVVSEAIRSIRSGFQSDRKTTVSTPASGLPVSPDRAWTSRAFGSPAHAVTARVTRTRSLRMKFEATRGKSLPPKEAAPEAATM